MVFRRTGDREAAADIVQDVFVRMLSSAGQRETDEEVKILYASARNATIDHVRTESRRRNILDRLTPSQLAAAPAVPDAIVEGREALATIDRALMQLSRTTRDIFLLRRVHGMSNADIAARYGISVSAVEKHVARALRHCQRSL